MRVVAAVVLGFFIFTNSFIFFFIFWRKNESAQLDIK